MKQTRRVCDKCNTEVGDWPGGPQLSFFLKRHSDGAGGMENDYVYGDLCPTCMVLFVRRIKAHFELDRDSKLAELFQTFVKG